MSDERLRRHLAAVVAVALAATIYLFAAGSSSLPSLWSFAQQARWAALFALCGLAILLAWVERPRRLPSVAFVLVAGLAALAQLSAVWSVHPLLTTKRAGTLVVLVITAMALASAASANRRTFDALLLGLLGGSVAVALTGVGLLVYDSSEALQAPTADMPVRLEGFGVSVNTVPTLLALALPIAAWYAWHGGRLLRYASWASFLLLGLSIFASGSRGATISSFVGVAFVIVAAMARVRVKALLLAGLVVFYVLAYVAFDQRGVLDELRRSAAPPIVTPSGPGATGGQAAPERDLPRVVPHHSYDVYTAGVSRIAPLEARGFFGAGDGRMVVWRDAIAQGMERPFAGFGFGNEEQVFVDRSSEFMGSRPENSFIGFFLQLGLGGLLVFVAALAACLLAFLRRRREGGAAVAAAGALVAGTAMCMFQSYVYSVGNIATSTFWIAALLAAAGTAAAQSSAGEADGAARARGVPGAAGRGDRRARLAQTRR